MTTPHTTTTVAAPDSVVHLSWSQVRDAAGLLARRAATTLGYDAVHGVPRGGVPVALLVAEHLGVPVVPLSRATPATLIVDDLVASGATLARYVDAGYPLVDALYRKPFSPPDIAPGAFERTGWLEFPWEETPLGRSPELGAQDGVRRLLEYVGEDPTREGLLDTPARVCRALREMTGGVHQDPATILATRFEERHDQMVVLSGIQFTSTCEHHLLPFVGTATVGYVPNGHVVGLSKLARLVDAYAARLQVQERLTEQVADALVTHLDAKGVGVTMSAHHACMGCRGVRKPTAVMTTCALRGVLLESPSARAEFLAHHHPG